MATAPPLTTQQVVPAPAAQAGLGIGPGAVQEPADQALVPVAPDNGEPLDSNSPVSRLPVEVDVAVPVRGFRVRSLLTIEPGTVIATEWPQGEDLPLAAGLVQLAWSEFEVVDAQLAVRVTRLT